MLNLRVVRQFDSHGESLVYTIEDIVPKHQRMGGYLHPFCRHEPYGLVVGDSVKELRERLKQMLAALDKPVLTLTPQRIESASLDDEEVE